MFWFPLYVCGPVHSGLKYARSISALESIGSQWSSLRRLLSCWYSMKKSTRWLVLSEQDTNTSTAVSLFVTSLWDMFLLTLLFVPPFLSPLLVLSPIYLLCPPPLSSPDLHRLLSVLSSTLSFPHRLVCFSCSPPLSLFLLIHAPWPPA